VRFRNITVYTDSQAALGAIAKPVVDSALVADCRRVVSAVQELGNSVNLAWIPGHRGYEGNEKADVLAKCGASREDMGPEPSVAVSKKVGKGQIRDWADRLAINCWNAIPACRQARLCIKKWVKGATACLLSLKRCDLRRMVGMFTGHYAVRRHLYKMGLVGDPFCRECELDEETVAHFLGCCDRYAAVRIRIFGADRPPDLTFSRATGVKVLEFVRSVGRFVDPH